MPMLVRGTALVLLLLALSACGGGGDSAPPPPPAQRGVLSFASAQSNAAEPGGTVSIVVNRVSGSEGDVSATVTITGSATSGTDFTAPTTVTFANGATTANIPVAITNDTDPEVDETVTLTLSGPTGGATLGSVTAYTLTIQSDDAPAAPTASIVANTKQLTFSWTAVPTATGYRLLVSSNGLAAFVPAMADIPDSTSATLPIGAHQLDWSAVRYRVAACNAAGCTESASLSTTNTQMLALIGAPLSSNHDENDFFGHTSTLSSNGSIMVIGAPAESSNASGINGDQNNDAAPGSGAAYVFERQATGLWTQQAYLKASNTRIAPSGGASFGSSLSISEDGSTLVVGAYGEPSPSTGVNGDQTPVTAALAGAAYVFNRSPTGQWTQSAYLKASNTDATDVFGSSVSISGDGRMIAVGAPGEDGSAILVNGADDNSTPEQGAVYVFALDANGWEQTAYIKPHLRISATARMQFGGKVALNQTGTTLAITTDRYGIYIYSRSTGTWEFDNVLQAGLRGLGTNVALSRDGNTFAASQLQELTPGGADAPGAVYVFSNLATAGWTRTATLQDPNSTAGQWFGSGLAIGANGNCIATGAYHEGSAALGINGDPFNNSGQLRGAAFYFELSDSNEWVQKSYIKAPTLETQALGHSLGMSGDCSVLLIATGTRPFLY